MKIDLVYLWVDGNDPKWIAKKNVYSTEKIVLTDLDSQARYANSDELKFSLRSVEKFANWVNKFISLPTTKFPFGLIQPIQKSRLSTILKFCLLKFSPVLTAWR